MEIAETLNTYFEYAVPSVGISEPKEFITSHENLNDSIDSILLKFSKHPSILMIKAIELKSTFSFNECTEIHSEINALNTKKSTPANNVSAKHLKEHIDICSEFLYEIINHNIRNSNFYGMKLADISPVHKKDDVTIKSNYRPISGLPAGSKIFERIIQRRIALHMETFLSPYLCGYRKLYSVQHALIALLEKLRLSFDNKGYGGGNIDGSIQGF